MTGPYQTTPTGNPWTDALVGALIPSVTPPGARHARIHRIGPDKPPEAPYWPAAWRYDCQLCDHWLKALDPDTLWPLAREHEHKVHPRGAETRP